MNENSETTRCARCGATLAPGALKGLCPRCLMALNLGPQTDVTGESANPDHTQTVKAPSPAAPAPEEIARLFPHLEVLGMLGRGGMGAVYKARQPKLDRLVALKILLRRPEGSTADTGFAERFAREARALARLNHPDIVAVYDYGEAGGYPYLLMEYVDGLTLRQLLSAGRLAPEEALAIVPKICEALEFAHQQGVVHRDIKPENILLDKQGRVKIADFGIAKILEPGAPDSSLTGGKDVVGTPHYMAPEQVEHPAKVDHRADIFSLGVVFYEMLTGELPLGKFPPPSRKVQVDVRLDEVVLRALEKEPERRYQHASQVKSDVETIAAAKGATSAEPAPGTPAGVEATKKVKGEFLGVGAAVQALGLACFFLPYVGPLVGVILLLIGGRMALRLICTRCGNRTTNTATICSTCGARFVAPEKPPAGRRDWATAVRWIARGAGTIWALFFLTFLIAEGSPPLPQQPGAVQMEFAAVALMLAGVVAGWWRDSWAALLALGGWALFQAAEGHVRWASLFNTPALAGVLFAVVWTQRLNPQLRRNAAVLVVGLPLVFALVLNLGWRFFGADKPVTVSGVITDAVTGRPIARARVDDNGYGAGPGQPSRHCWSDTDGRFHLQTFYEEHTLAASAPGYETELTTLLTKPFGSEREVKMDFQLTPARGANATLTPDWERAVALFNEIEDFGHEFEAAFTSTNLAAAQTGTTRLLNLLTNYNASVAGTDYAFPRAIFGDILQVQNALAAGQWEAARQAAAHNEEYARAFQRIGSALREVARRKGTSDIESTKR